MIYAGAQKNAGPAGVTILVMKKSFLDQASEDVPAILSYKTHAKNDSMYNTPPVFSIYTFGLVLKWIEGQGGLKAVEAANRKKAEAVYSALDEYPDVYDPAVTDKGDRSLMNITFRLKNAAKEGDFLKGAEALGMDGLKGHRSVGGFRASIYNAFPAEGCQALAKYLHDFAKR
jgi:phosphoserine aminotransferase